MLMMKRRPTPPPLYVHGAKLCSLDDTGAHAIVRTMMKQLEFEMDKKDDRKKLKTFKQCAASAGLKRIYAFADREHGSRAKWIVLSLALVEPEVPEANGVSLGVLIHACKKGHLHVRPEAIWTHHSMARVLQRSVGRLDAPALYDKLTTMSRELVMQLYSGGRGLEDARPEEFKVVTSLGTLVCKTLDSGQLLIKTYYP